MVKLLGEFNIVPSDIDAILITHTHKDHVGGLASFIKKNKIPVYTNEMMFASLSEIEEDTIRVCDDVYSLWEFNIEVIHTSHDAIGSVGFIVKENDSSLVYVTDTGYINKMYLERLKNKNVYIFESNHDINMLMTGPYPYILKQRVISDKGHLSNELAGEYLKEIIGDKTKKIILAHLSETNNTHEIALKTVSDILNCDITLDAAYQDKTMDIGEF